MNVTPTALFEPPAPAAALNSVDAAAPKFADALRAAVPVVSPGARRDTPRVATANTPAKASADAPADAPAEAQHDAATDSVLATTSATDALPLDSAQIVATFAGLPATLPSSLAAPRPKNVTTTTLPPAPAVEPPTEKLSPTRLPPTPTLTAQIIVDQAPRQPVPAIGLAAARAPVAAAQAVPATTPQAMTATTPQTVPAATSQHRPASDLAASDLAAPEPATPDAPDARAQRQATVAVQAAAAPQQPTGDVAPEMPPAAAGNALPTRADHLAAMPTAAAVPAMQTRARNADGLLSAASRPIATKPKRDLAMILPPLPPLPVEIVAPLAGSPQPAALAATTDMLAATGTRAAVNSRSPAQPAANATALAPTPDAAAALPPSPPTTPQSEKADPARIIAALATAATAPATPPSVEAASTAQPPASAVAPAPRLEPLPTATAPTASMLRTASPDPVDPTPPLLRRGAARATAPVFTDTITAGTAAPLPAPSAPARAAATPQPSAPTLVETEALGAVSIALAAATDATDAALKVHFTVDRGSTAHALLDGARLLDGALQASGSRLDQLSVDVRGGDAHASNGDTSGQRAPSRDPHGHQSPRAPLPPRTPRAVTQDRFA